MHKKAHDISRASIVTDGYAAERLSAVESAAALATGLGMVFDAALVRVWLIGRGDRCSACEMAPICPRRDACLHLVASAGLTTRVDGRYSRFPLDAPPAAEVARTLAPVVLRHGLETAALAERSWLGAHRIASFGAWPLVADGRCQGMLALFSRRLLSDEDVRALGAFARLASHAIESRGTTRGAGDGERVATLADAQRRAILAALGATGGRVSGAGGAAELLGMRPTTLESRIRRLGLRKPPRGIGSRAPSRPPA